MNLKGCSIEALYELQQKYPYDKEITSEINSRTTEIEEVSIFPLIICVILMITFLVLAVINRIHMNLEFLGLSIICFLASTSWTMMLLIKLRHKFK